MRAAFVPWAPNLAAGLEQQVPEGRRSANEDLCARVRRRESLRAVRRGTADRPGGPGGHSRAVRKRNALVITETELRLIASAAIIGDSSQPVKG